MSLGLYSSSGSRRVLDECSGNAFDVYLLANLLSLAWVCTPRSSHYFTCSQSPAVCRNSGPRPLRHQMGLHVLTP